jgi:hypothetical protein
MKKNNDLPDITNTKLQCNGDKKFGLLTKKEKALMRKGRLYETKVSIKVKVHIKFDYEDGRWIADIPSIPGAMVYGRSRSEAQRKVIKLASSVLTSREVGSALSNRYHLTLDDHAYQRLIEALDGPPADNPKLRALLRSKAPWTTTKRHRS